MSVLVELVPFEPKHLPLVERWFDDPEVQSRLGGREWPAREFRLMAEPPGTEFRGAMVTGRFDWVAFDGEEAVGLIVGETYDRWTIYGGEGSEGPIILDAIELPAMGLAFVVDPLRWRQGYCKAMARAVLHRSEVADVRVFGAGVEPDNEGSIRCMAALGFTRASEQPDFEGMLYYLYVR